MTILKTTLALFFLLFATVASLSETFSYEFKVSGDGTVKIIFQNSYLVDDKKLTKIRESMEKINGIVFVEHIKRDSLQIGPMLMEGQTIKYHQTGGNYSAVAQQIATVIRNVVTKKKEKIRQVWPEVDHSG